MEGTTTGLFVWILDKLVLRFARRLRRRRREALRRRGGRGRFDVTQRPTVGIAWEVVPGNLWRRGGGQSVVDMVLLAVRIVVANGVGLVKGSQVAWRGGGLMG